MLPVPWEQIQAFFSTVYRFLECCRGTGIFKRQSCGTGTHGNGTPSPKTSPIFCVCFGDRFLTRFPTRLWFACVTFRPSRKGSAGSQKALRYPLGLFIVSVGVRDVCCCDCLLKRAHGGMQSLGRSLVDGESLSRYTYMYICEEALGRPMMKPVKQCKHMEGLGKASQIGCALQRAAGLLHTVYILSGASTACCSLFCS